MSVCVRITGAKDGWSFKSRAARGVHGICRWKQWILKKFHGGTKSLKRLLSQIFGTHSHTTDNYFIAELLSAFTGLGC